MEVYLRIADKAGVSFVSNHTAWDADLFIASTRARYVKEGGTVKVISPEEYRDEKWGTEWRTKVRK